MNDYKEGRNIADYIDSHLLSYNSEIEKIKSSEFNDNLNSNNEMEKYIQEIVNGDIKLYKEYENIYFNLLESIGKVHMSFPEIKEYAMPYSFDNARNKFIENNKLVMEITDKLNKYMFQDNPIPFKFDNENAKINGINYSAPNFPEFVSDDFDNDHRYKKLVSDLYGICKSQLNNLFYLKNNCSKVINNDKNLVDKKSRILEIIRNQNKEKYRQEYEATYLKLKFHFNNEILSKLKNVQELDSYNTIGTFKMPTSFQKNINIGKINYKYDNYNTYKEILSQIDDNGMISENASFPFFLELNNKGNVLINTNNIDHNITEFVHQLIMQFITSVPCKKMNLVLVDQDFSKFELYNYSKEYILDNKLLRFDKVITSEDHSKEAISFLIDKISEIKSKVLSYFNKNNIFDYNEQSVENTESFNLLVLVDFPKHIDNDTANKLSTLMKNGNKCGIFTILVNDESISLSQNEYEYNKGKNDEFLKSIENSSTIINYDFNTARFEIDGLPFIPNKAFGSNDISEFFKKLKEDCSIFDKSQIIDLKSIINIEYEKEPYYKKIKIPVGKNGGEVECFELDVDGTGTSSAIIAGGTGSGKSSFLHTIILSGAYNYAPDELKYYLVDFKDGVEFSPYKNDIKIPHIAFLSLQNKLEDAYDILQMVYNEKEKRNEYFKKVGVSDIKSYQNNPLVTSGEYPSFERIVVVIDEYQNFLESPSGNFSALCNKCAQLLVSLLKEIRSVGISLILSSQSICIDNDALNQINNRYVFKAGNTDLSKAFQEISIDELNSKLSKEKGLVCKTKDGGIKTTIFKTAYSGKTGDEKQREIVGLINDKWKNKNPQQLIVSGDENSLPIYKVEIMQKSDIEQLTSNIYRVYFGESAKTSTNVYIDLDYSEKSSYLILGNIKKARNIEGSIGLSYLNSLKNKNIKIDKERLYYFDLNNTPFAYDNPSPFGKYKSEFIDVMTYCNNSDDISNNINLLYNTYLSRKHPQSGNNNFQNRLPILIFINSFEWLSEIEYESPSINQDEQLQDLINLDSSFSSSSSDSNLIDKIKELYTKGYSYNIFVIVHKENTNGINGYDNFFDLHKVICCDKNKMDVCRTENDETITITNLPSNYTVLYPEVLKNRPYEFDFSDKEKLYLTKLLEDLKNG